MGISSNYLIELIEEKYFSARNEWIRERLDNTSAENSVRWNELSEEFDGSHSYDDYEYDSWLVFGKSRTDIFNEIVFSIQEVLKTNYSEPAKRNILVMAHGHIVASIEAFLSTTFIDHTLSSEEKIRLLVESDPEFSKRTFTVKEIFTKKENLTSEVSLYLHGLIFHNIEKIKPMYKSVFGIDFGDIGWLKKAIVLRHHCVHRAGYDKDGNEVDLQIEDIEGLINNCSKLVWHIESKILNDTFSDIPF